MLQDFSDEEDSDAADMDEDFIWEFADCNWVYHVENDCGKGLTMNVKGASPETAEWPDAAAAFGLAEAALK